MRVRERERERESIWIDWHTPIVLTDTSVTLTIAINDTQREYFNQRWSVNCFAWVFLPLLDMSWAVCGLLMMRRVRIMVRKLNLHHRVNSWVAKLATVNTHTDTRSYTGQLCWWSLRRGNNIMNSLCIQAYKYLQRKGPKRKRTNVLCSWKKSPCYNCNSLGPQKLMKSVRGK